MILENVLWTALPNGFDPDGRLRLSVHVAPRLVNDDGSDTERKLGGVPGVRRTGRRARNRCVSRSSSTTARRPRALPRGDADRRAVEPALPARHARRPHVFQDHAERDLHVVSGAGRCSQFLEQAYGAAGATGHRPPVDRRRRSARSRLPAARPSSRTGSADSQTRSTSELARAQQPPKQRATARSCYENVASASPAARRSRRRRTRSSRPTASTTGPGSQRPDLPADYNEPIAEAARLRVPRGRVRRSPTHPAAAAPPRARHRSRRRAADARRRSPPRGVVRVDPGGRPSRDAARSPVDALRARRAAGSAPGRSSSFRMHPRAPPPEPRVLRPVPGRRRRRGAARRSTSPSTLRPHARSGPPHRGDAETRRPCRRCARPASRSRGRARASCCSRTSEGRRGRTTTFEAGHRHGVRRRRPRARLPHRRLRRGRPGRRRAGSRSTAASSSTLAAAADGERRSIHSRSTDEGYLKATSRVERDQGASDALRRPLPARDDLRLGGLEPAGAAAGQAHRRAGRGRRRRQHRAPRPASRAIRSPSSADVQPAPRTLPRLRVGHRYRLRARTVDLAGNSRPFSERDLEPPEPRPRPPRRSATSASSRCRRPRCCGATSTPRASRSSTS